MIDPSYTANNSPSTNSTEQWFDSLQALTPTPPRNGRKKHLIIGAVVFISLALLGTASALLFGQSPLCLDGNDYKALTGNDTSDLNPPTNSFYTNYVLFADNSTAYDDTPSSREHGSQLIQKIADFYESSAGKSVIITISGNYFTTESKALVGQRVASVKASLLAAGIPEKALLTKDPLYIEPEDPPTITSETILTVSSASPCTTN